LRRRVQLLQTQQSEVLTWGLLRPKLLLPADAETWSTDRIRIVLHHEFAHVRRHDWLWQMLAECLRTIYWFNPLCWIVCERLVQESEQACDDAALSCGIERSEYAEELLSLTLTLHRPKQGLSAALSMARPSTLERRFAALLNPMANRAAVTRMSALAAVFAMSAVAVPIVSLRLAAEPAPEPIQVQEGVHVLPTSMAPMGPPAVQSVDPSPLEKLTTALVALLPQNPLAQPQPPQGPGPAGAAPQATGTASIEGVVVKFGTSEPIGMADVSLQRGLGAPPTVIQTGPDGKFAFRNLADGNYRLVALRAEGFVVAEHGQRTPNGRGRPVILAAGQRIADLTLAMLPTGSISGQILDREGEPLGRAQVQALQATYREGRKVLKIVQSVQTNDAGEYRLFWLPPGSYYLSARPEDSRRRSVPLFVNLPGTGGNFEQAAPPVVTRRVLDNGSTAEESFVLVYFPGTADLTTASRIDVRPGDSLGGMNFAVTSGQVPARHIRGRVIDANGQPVPGSVSAILRTPHPNATIPTAIADAGGRFDIGGVVPGLYYVIAQNASGITAVEVRGADLDNIVVSARPGFDVEGRVTIEGKPSLETDPDVAKLQGSCGPGITNVRCLPLRFNLVAEPALIGFPVEVPGMPGAQGTLPSGAVLADGTFTFRNLGPREYRMSSTGLPPDWYIKSVRFGTVDPISTLVSFAAAASEKFEVVLGVNGGRLEGRVVDATGRPVPSAMAVLVPELSKRGRRDLYRNAVSDDSGQFRFQNIAPGDYKVFAWEEIDLSSWLDPEIVGPVESRGRPIHIPEGGRETAEVGVIPVQR
jgi:protocatechuate 3,4-dioxygenase beta subunit